jgi:hypothetical protein
LAGDRRPHGESKKSAASTGLSAVIFFTDIAFFRKKAIFVPDSIRMPENV